jgi:hypothetical protein
MGSNFPRLLTLHPQASGDLWFITSSSLSAVTHCHVCTISTENVINFFHGVRERGLLDMRILPLSCPHPLPVSFPTLSLFPWQLKTTAVQASFKETSAGNSILFFFVNYVSAPGGMSCDGGRPTRHPQGKPKVCCL